MYKYYRAIIIPIEERNKLGLGVMLNKSYINYPSDPYLERENFILSGYTEIYEAGVDINKFIE